MKYWHAVVFVALLLLAGASLVGCSFSKQSQSNQAATQTASKAVADSLAAKRGTAIGNTAPDFQLAQIDGSAVSLAHLRGQPAVLIFWTAWCPVCKEEAPHFNKLAALYEPKGVRVLGINIQDSEARTRAGIKDFGIQYSVARDADASVARLYEVTGTPTVIFLDGQGIVRYKGHELPPNYAERFDALVGGKV